MDKLTAVNKLLKMIGTRKVTSVAIRHPDVSDAVEELEQWTESLLKRGWWFNRRNRVVHQPNSNGEIVFGLNVLRIEIPDGCRSPVGSIAKHDRRLYNADDNTYTFNHSMELTVFVGMEWDDLPDSAQYYIVYRAGSEFVRDKLEDTAKSAALRLEADGQMEDLQAEEIRTEKVNMFNNPSAAKLRRGRRPFSRT
ncbi:tail protein [Vibrio phage K436]